MDRFFFWFHIIFSHFTSSCSKFIRLRNGNRIFRLCSRHILVYTLQINDLLQTACYPCGHRSQHNDTEHDADTCHNQSCLEIIGLALLSWAAERPHKHQNDVHTGNTHQQHADQPLTHADRLFPVLSHRHLYLGLWRVFIIRRILLCIVLIVHIIAIHLLFLSSESQS